MTAILLLLVGLALLDATSVGTLGIPLFMLLAERARIRLVIVYLLVLAAFYWLVGLLLYLGGVAVLEAVGAWTWLRWVELAVGVVFLACAFLPRSLWAGSMQAAGRIQQRVAVTASLGGAAVLAVVAGLIEITGMYPYLAGIGIIIAEELPGAVTLAGYCALMIAPGIVLALLRAAVRERIEPVLARFRAWIERTSGTVAALTFAVFGILLILDAALNRFHLLS